MYLDIPMTERKRHVDTRHPLIRVVQDYVAIHFRHLLVPMILLGAIVSLNVSIRPAMMEVSRLISAQMELISHEGDGQAAAMGSYRD